MGGRLCLTIDFATLKISREEKFANPNEKQYHVAHNQVFYSVLSECYIIGCANKVFCKYLRLELPSKVSEASLRR